MDPSGAVTGEPANTIPDSFLQTARLEFRPFRDADLDALVAMHSDPAVYRYVGDSTPLDRKTAQLWIDNSRANIARYGIGSGAIVLRKTGELIGWGGFARPEGEPPELIYGFAKAYWGQGYASELIPALIGLTVDRPDCQPLRATVDRDNHVSVHLLTKFGFTLAERDFEGDVGCDLYVRPPASGPSSSPHE